MNSANGTPGAAPSTLKQDLQPAACSAQAQPHQAVFKFACPACVSSELLAQSGSYGGESFHCSQCGQSFHFKRGCYLDLVIGHQQQEEQQQQQQQQQQQRAPSPKRFWLGTDMFRLPIVSALYERGWRQSFKLIGFPGTHREFEAAMAHYAAGSALGGVMVDVSCATGLFSRLFAASGAFKGVVALDYSESMLLQAQQFFQADAALKDSSSSSTPIIAVRGDVGHLPFQSGSIDAIHAGAALHCWPDPQAGLREIGRVLRPGGVLVASTFLSPLAPLGAVFGDQAVRPYSQALNPWSFSRRRLGIIMWEEEELSGLTAAAGLTGFSSTRQRNFIMFTARKPVQ